MRDPASIRGFTVYIENIRYFRYFLKYHNIFQPSVVLIYCYVQVHIARAVNRMIGTLEQFFVVWFITRIRHAVACLERRWMCCWAVLESGTHRPTLKAKAWLPRPRTWASRQCPRPHRAQGQGHALLSLRCLNFKATRTPTLLLSLLI